MSLMGVRQEIFEIKIALRYFKYRIYKDIFFYTANKKPNLTYKYTEVDIWEMGLNFFISGNGIRI